MEVRVGFQGTIQKVFCIRILGQAAIDHAGMKQEQRIVSVQGKSSVDRFGRFLESAITVEDPRQGCPGVKVVPEFKLFSRKLQSLWQLDPLICIEEGQFAIGQYLI